MGSIDRQDSTPQLLNRLRMRQVALILAIDEQGTLRAAAGQLGLTQPAATKMLHDLEDALGLPLFDRVGRGLKLNAAGERVTCYFQNFRGGMEALNRELLELRRGSAGRLAVGSIMAASPGRLTRALLDLRAQWPMLSMEVAVDTSDRLLSQLREGVLEVVLGRLTGEDGDEYEFRAIDDEALLNYGFNFYESHKLYAAGTAITKFRVWKGADGNVPVGVTHDIYVTIPKGSYPQLSASVQTPSGLMAPVPAGMAAGSVSVSYDGKTLIETPLYTLQAVPEGNIFRRIIDSVRLWFVKK